MVEGMSFAVFLTGALLLNLTPGPDMAFTIASTARGGTRSGVAAALGVGAGSLVWAAVTAAGLAALLAASENALTIIRIAGGFYLLHLAVRTLLSKETEQETSAPSGLVKAFRAGVMTNLFNPKVGLFFLAFLPGFVDAQAGAVAVQILFLGALFSFTGTCVLVLVALAAGFARRQFVGSSRFQTGMKVASASMFGGLGAYLLFSHNR